MAVRQSNVSRNHCYDTCLRRHSVLVDWIYRRFVYSWRWSPLSSTLNSAHCLHQLLLWSLLVSKTRSDPWSEHSKVSRISNHFMLLLPRHSSWSLLCLLHGQEVGGVASRHFGWPTNACRKLLNPHWQLDGLETSRHRGGLAPERWNLFSAYATVDFFVRVYSTFGEQMCF